MVVNADHGLALVNQIMSQLGFVEDQQGQSASESPQQVNRVRYLDASGNEISLNFSLSLSQHSSGISIKAVFNQKFSRTWYSFETLINGLSVTVRRWKELGTGTSSKSARGRSKEPVAAPSGSKPAGHVVRQVSAKAIAKDIRSGMDDASLIKKYGFSSSRLLSVLAKLVWEGLLTPEEIEERRSLAKTVYMAVFQCRLCKEIAFEYQDACPRCGGPMTIANRRDEAF